MIWDKRPNEGNRIALPTVGVPGLSFRLMGVHRIECSLRSVREIATLHYAARRFWTFGSVGRLPLGRPAFDLHDAGTGKPLLLGELPCLVLRWEVRL